MLKTSAGRVICSLAALAIVPLAVASEAMPVAQQNALVQTYCAVCHTDAARNGGLTLQHFDAAHPDSGVAEMMLGKLVSGLTPKQIQASHHDPSTATLVLSRMKNGAMGAAGVPVPDRATQDALLDALAAQSAGATQWNTNQSGSVTTAGMVREVSSPTYGDSTDLYRLTLTCHADTHEAETQVSWVGPSVPSGREVFVATDDHAPVTYRIDGKEKMGNGTSAITGPGSATLAVTPLPAKTLTVSNLFPDETVAFPLSSLPGATRKALSSCFDVKSSKR